MKKIMLLTPLILALSLVIPESFCRSQTVDPPNSKTTITIAGSGANLGITRLLVQTFAQKHPQISINIPGSIGSKGAIKATSDGAIHLGLIVW